VDDVPPPPGSCRPRHRSPLRSRPVGALLLSKMISRSDQPLAVQGLRARSVREPCPHPWRRGAARGRCSSAGRVLFDELEEPVVEDLPRRGRSPRVHLPQRSHALHVAAALAFFLAVTPTRSTRPQPSRPSTAPLSTRPGRPPPARSTTPSRHRAHHGRVPRVLPPRRGGWRRRHPFATPRHPRFATPRTNSRVISRPAVVASRVR